MAGVRPSFETVVASLYEAAAVAQLWPSALQGLADLTGSRGALITRPDLNHAGLISTTSLNDTIGQFFEQNWHQDDLRSARIVRRPTGRFVCDQDITSHTEREGSAYYEGFARSAGVPWFAACGLVEADGTMVGVSIQRSAAQGPFEAADREQLRQLEPHVRAALAFSRRMAVETETARLEGTGMAAVLLDHTGRVLRTSPSAELELARVATVRHGRIVALDPRVRAALDRLIERACGPDRAAAGEALAPVRLDGPRNKVLVQAVPLVGAVHDLIGDGRAILTLTPVGRAVAADPELLAAAFGLTPAETRAAHLLSRGMEPAAIAANLELSVSAVRFHMKAIFRKAGVQRQAAFVAAAAALRRPN